ncbi:peptide-methionine (S)-S-oxide reductase MsrA [Natronospirillum operosum]|uniref:Peptide methionine sulfoxide reductase MsrA n=1 Tax=Natronospirillum operosum TaxID=2759953 RepID=A0A4Z0WAS8_9GAMM|nr:peptide-methionine (S)-S-oxide reductase MsrA [Natronospirillum operosum]TGG91071.1 peptide-methionine (S)-S-oxide reductase MsrA [Natronospirillum operosum]
MPGLFSKDQLPESPAAALPGRETPLSVEPVHAVLGTSMVPPFPAGKSELVVGMGCFWGAERLFWSLSGVYTTAVGYTGGYTPNPTYEEVCSGQTGHAEVVRIIYDPQQISLQALLQVFWESHDPTQGMRQGNDRGSQYRSALYLPDAASEQLARDSLTAMEKQLQQAGYGAVTTEVARNQTFYYAETYHQQYLHKNPAGYCGIKGTGVSCPVGQSS